MGQCVSQNTEEKQSSKELKSWIESEIKAHDVMIWSKSWCGYCARTKAVFQNPDFGKIDVQIHELDKLPDGRAIQDLLESETGQRTVPNVWIKGKFIGGNDDTQKALLLGTIHSSLGIAR